MNRINYLLTLLSEECAETSQRATKAIRFGLDEVQKGQDMTNSERLVYEFNDIFCIMQILHEEGYIDKVIDEEALVKKREKIIKYYNYSKDLGLID